MALEARIRELGSRHQSLEAQIEDEMTSPSGDDLKVQQLKKEKLRLKEEIEALKAQVH